MMVQIDQSIYMQRMLPPKDVYSTNITNSSGAQITAVVQYEGIDPEHAETLTLTIPAGATVSAPEKSVNMGTWTAAKVIKKITVGDRVINAPFPGVSSPMKDLPLVFPTNF
ncbi:uncharacterized protein MONOS_4369 [Monocercomonoides exilis]|uniref:uncharacterized protein n=1 Tax=Monocercomonoides exilis TaxID=2049356 RepID=UPI00355A395C|nr:hypothetical protein MONOS_4369 [Monocercomonoides exilis]|eukprot:MONOS_4369.1-p1 / transcript=MONOS_4369.1 / gene=MONOS_4369 / organism=Monocercomonoides_exilis_PA203 / gene_product=unspecified product / transcript_product=unspecified product / location=Mono_scaffold00115:72777-73245(+) / protein_length=111 / sequence_SO=supercontig / SO=protein_coding / is_pseudo=false